MLKVIGIILSLFLNYNLMAEETIKLVGGDSTPPLMWNDHGVAKGVALEIGRAILLKAGFKVEVQSCRWTGCIFLAEKNGAFIVAFSKNEERLKKFYYSENTMFDEVVLVTQKGKEFPFKKPSDLKGKVIGALMGASYGENFEILKKEINLHIDNDDITRLKNIMLGKLDAGIFSLGMAGVSYTAKESKIPMADLTILPDLIAKDPNFIATGMNTPNALEKIKKINAALKELQADGTIDKIMKMTY